MKLLGLRTFGVLFFFSLIIFLADGTGLVNSLRSIVLAVAAPVEYSFYSARQLAVESFSFLTFWKSGEARIRNLELRIMELNATKSEAERLKIENEQLRQQLGVAALKDEKMLPATVLGLGRYLEIGAGEKEGVRVGQTAVFLNNLVGKITRVTSRTSFVLMPSDPIARVPVRIGSAYGLVSGQFNSAVIVDHLAQNEEINENDPIVTSGEGESFPPGLVVGKTGKILSSETDLFKKATVEPLFLVGRLTTVFVLVD